MDNFSTITPNDKNVLTYKFGNGVPSGDVLTGAIVVVSVTYGTDPNPTNIINGTAIISGTDVLVPFASTLPNVDYDIGVVVTTNNPQRVLSLAKKLPSRPI
jgi:hypothetical protein